MSDISCQLLSCQISQMSDITVVRYHSSQIFSCQLSDYQLVMTSAVVGDISYYKIINHIDCLLIKDTITRGTGVIAWWCMSCILEGLIMVPSCGSNHGEPRLYWLPIHLSVVRAMPGLRRHASCLFVWGCGLQLSEPCGLSWFSARGVRPWYRACRYSSKTHALHWQAVTTTIKLFDMWENSCGMGHS